ncbi:MAG TPA: ABC transporter permease [Candidatus Angelobacter sp.]|jgi:predicted permease|nr:ABC transporter permease [Candidatus Angelobacter sp.]
MSANLLTSLPQDLRYGARILLRSPGFYLIAILTLALGIGANTAIFSVVNGVLLNPLPFHHSDQLVSMFQEIPNFKNGSISYPNFIDWRRMNTTFAGMAAYRSVGFNLSGNGVPERLHGEMISAGFFEILGVNPLMGRTFAADEDRLGANPTVMITEGLWKRKFGSRNDIVGQRVVLDDVGRTIIGVVPSSFHLRIQNFQRGDPLNEVYVPVGEYNEPKFYGERGAGWGLDGIGRLKPGVTLEQAREDMDRVSRDLAAAYPDIDSDKKANILSLKDEMLGNMRPILLILLGAVGFVLLISCVNVANLLLARSTARQNEFAIRIALGAGQQRVIRQLLAESLLLAMIGGGLGLVVAKFGTSAALVAVPGTLPRSEDIGLDLRVLLFTLVISILAGIVFGLAPAWKAVRGSVGGTLSESGRAVAGARGSAQSIFVVGEMAMALVLLIGAGLMIRTLFHLWGLDPGFNPKNVMTFSLSGPSSYKSQPPDSIRAAYRQIHDKLASAPGIEAASFSLGAHPMGSDDEEFFWFMDKPMPTHQTDLAMAVEYVVEPDYLRVMHIPVKRGRFFTASDNEHAPAVVVIDETLAAKYFPNRDPVGQYLNFNANPANPDKVPNPQIIGIVGHVNQWGLDNDGPGALHAQVYLPLAQTPDKEIQRNGMAAEVFTRQQAHGNSNLATLRSRILEYNSELVVHHPEDMEKTVADSISNKRFTMTLLGVFALLALLLASIGIYGVLSYMVGQRTREIGIRMALGAQKLDVLGMVLKDGAHMTLVGISLGMVAALGLTRLMRSMLYGIRPTDPLTFLSVSALLGAIAMFACYVPARRAMKVDPMEALRHQ